MCCCCCSDGWPWDDSLSLLAGGASRWSCCTCTCTCTCTVSMSIPSTRVFPWMPVLSLRIAVGEEEEEEDEEAALASLVIVYDMMCLRAAASASAMASWRSKMVLGTRAESP